LHTPPHIAWPGGHAATEDDLELEVAEDEADGLSEADDVMEED
jgi:hypothetical protein